MRSVETRADRLRRALDAAEGPRKRGLANRAPRSSGFFVHGWKAVGFGALLLGAVVVAVAPSADKILARPLVDWDFDWMMGAWGAAFVGLMGLALLRHGVRDLRRVGRMRLMNAAFYAEPWRWDYEWDERHSLDDDTARRARFYVGMGVGLLALLAPWLFISIGLVVTGAPLIMTAIAVPFALIGLLFVIIAVVVLMSGLKLVWRRLKYGQGTAVFARFPFRVGGELELRIQAPRSLPQHAMVTTTLRCIQEEYVTTKKRDGEIDTSVECFEVFRATGVAEQVNSSADARSLRVRFAIPADAPTTDLATRPCRYWEVDVNAATDGVDYAARFLVPVY